MVESFDSFPATSGKFPVSRSPPSKQREILNETRQAGERASLKFRARGE